MKHIYILSVVFFILCCAQVNASGSDKKKINIILIEVDSLRPDHLGCYGYHLNTSPNIDKFAKNANLYLNCFSAATWTLPSNYSLLTSLYLPQHKVYSWNSFIDKQIPNIINVLYNDGYSIGIFGSQGFLFKNLKENFSSMLTGYKLTSSTFAVKSATDWIESQQTPFFIWLSLLEPHRPYRSPPEHSKLFLQRREIKLQMSKAGKYCWGGGRHFFKVINKNGIDTLTYYSAKYDASIHYVDSIIGLFLENLKRYNRFNDSLIIFISDHGESLGEHKLYFNHTWNLFNEIIKVPLIIKLPGQASGRIIKNDAGLIDVFPTIMDEAGIKMGISLEGIPLRKIDNKKRELLSFRSSAYYCLIHDKWKLIRYPGGSKIRNAYIKSFFPEYPKEKLQLINFKNNPSETINFAKENKPVYEKMKTKIREYSLRMKSSKYKRSSFKMDEEIKRSLKSLGYLN